jgi:hypothetical protein
MFSNDEKYATCDVTDTIKVHATISIDDLHVALFPAKSLPVSVHQS